MDRTIARPDRRAFLRSTAAGLAAVSSGTFIGPVLGDSSQKRSSESIVRELYNSLGDGQRDAICFPVDHALRGKVDNNWHIVEKPIEKVLAPDQRAMVREIFRGLHSEEYADAVYKQVDQDNSYDGGFNGCSVAIFGDPNDGGYELVFTGRHVTRRCEGRSTPKAAFGGPIFYGHAASGFHEEPDHPGNAYWYQALRANEVFDALDPKQRKVALRDDPRDERGTQTVALRGEGEGLAGIPVSELTGDQKNLVGAVLKDLLAPFRESDAKTARKMVEEQGDLDALSMAFYKNRDLGDDGVWDLWQIEGPRMVWYFRGAPHVHTWVHVRGTEGGST